MEVFLEVTVQHKKYHAGFMERMRQQPEVTSCYQVEGEYDFLVKADVTSEKELEKLERSVRKINGVCSVQPVYALQARIKLVQATRHTIKHALNILGVSAPERM